MYALQNRGGQACQLYQPKLLDCRKSEQPVINYDNKEGNAMTNTYKRVCSVITKYSCLCLKSIGRQMSDSKIGEDLPFHFIQTF